MMLKTALVQAHSKEQTLKISAWIGTSTAKVKELIDLLLAPDRKQSLKAAWVMSTVAEQRPAMIQPHLFAIIAKLSATNIEAGIKRHVLRAIQFLELEEELHEPILNYCFEYLVNPREALAVRAFALTTVARLSSNYPELRQEIKLIIEDAMLHEPAPSFKSRAVKILKII